MNVVDRSRLLGSALGLILFTAAPSFAIVLPILQVANDGSISVTTMSFNFPTDQTNNTLSSFATTPGSSAITPNSSTATPHSAEVATGTSFNYSGRALMASRPAEGRGGASGSAGTLSLANSFRFPEEPGLSVSLDSFAFGKTSADCTGLGSNDLCSPAPSEGLGSPIILTATSGGTGAFPSHSGTEFDNGIPVGSVPGNFAATITPFTPAQAASSSTDSFTQTSPATFTVTMVSATPEPREISQISLVVIAGLLVGLVVKRRKGEA